MKTLTIVTLVVIATALAIGTSKATPAFAIESGHFCDETPTRLQ